MACRRILITGLSSQLGGRLAQALEREADIEAVVGIDSSDPRHELARTEFVRVGMDRQQLRRIINAAAIDTVIDTRMLADPLQASLRRAHEINVVDTGRLIAACADPESPVQKLVFKSSANYYGWESDDPAFLGEDMVRSGRVRTAIQREVVAAEDAVLEFGARSNRTVTIVRVADEIGGDQRTSHQALLSLPVVPSTLGFDPRFQFIHHEDVVGALAHVVEHELPGIFNAAGDGVLVLSEVVSLLGKTMLPVLPPWGAGLAAAQLRRLGLRVPVEMLRQLRYGRGLDNRRLKASGYAFRYTSREAVLRLRAEQRLRPLLRSGSGESYRYEPDVEEFLRWSPHVRETITRRPPVRDGGAPMAGYDELADSELIDLIPSLDPDALTTLRVYETQHRGRATVLEALDSTLARKREE